MDVFSVNKTDYTNGKIINNIDSLIWVEKYKDPSEFTIQGPTTLAFRNSLAIGTFISHPDTKELMVVETHSIDETKEDGPAFLEVKGRSVQALALENRVGTMSVTSGWTGTITTRDFTVTLGDVNTWDQIVSLITSFVKTSLMGSAENIPNFNVSTNIPGTDPDSEERVLERIATIADSVDKMLDSINAGLQVKRPEPGRPTLDFLIHKGVDRSSTVRFDWRFGDVDKARYFWTEENYKNAAYVASDTHGLRIRPAGVTGWDLQIMPVNASDWKDVSGTLTYIGNIFKRRGNDAIRKQKKETIIDATIAKSTRYTYGVDYNIGDIVHVTGNYGINSTMRVVEYALTFDKTGASGFPTLEAIPEL